MSVGDAGNFFPRLGKKTYVLSFFVLILQTGAFALQEADLSEPLPLKLSLGDALASSRAGKLDSLGKLVGEGQLSAASVDALQGRSVDVPKRQHVFDLTDFGAVSDGITDNSRVFQNAIYAVSTVAEKGGGQLYVPPGKYLTGSFNLTSHMTLYLASDAVILGLRDTSKWPVLAELPSYGRGREMPGPRYSSLIHGQNLTDVIITGENGTIDGQGSFWWDLKSSGQLNFSRGPLIELLWTSHILISNVTLQNSPFWTLHPTYCNNVTITSVTISSPPDSPNTDGVVPDSCSNVLISDTRISSGGQAVALRSGWDEYGMAYGMACTNVTLRDSFLEASQGASFAIGSEMSGGISGILVQNVRIRESRIGILVKTGKGRGGYIRDVLVENVTMHHVGTAIKFSSNSTEHADSQFDPSALPAVQGLQIRNVVGANICIAGHLHGLPQAPFLNIELGNVKLALVPGGLGFNCSYVNGSAWDVAPEPCPELCNGKEATCGLGDLSSTATS